MLTSKQRAILRGKANTMDPVFIVGKGEIDETMIQGVKDCLDARELIKLKVLESSMYNAREASVKLAEATGADCVQVIGSKFVLYLQKKEGQRLRRPAEVMRILLYGGSFDPPHYGHLNNLRAAAARVCPDRVVVMPAGCLPLQAGTSAPRRAPAGDVRLLRGSWPGRWAFPRWSQRLGDGAGGAGPEELHGAHAGNAGRGRTRR